MAENKNLELSGVTLSVKQPYAEGHALNANEAGVLNQTFLENVRNNVAGKLRGYEAAFRKDEANAAAIAAEGFTWAPTAEQLAEVAAYADAYEFGARVARTSEPVDPVQREAHRIAKEVIDGALKAKNVKKATLPEGAYDQMVAKVAAGDDIQKEAKRRAKAKESIGAAALDLALGNAEPKAAAEDGAEPAAE